jgi:4-hydroxy-3-methylbut-2-enyl diphosphate reductase
MKLFLISPRGFCAGVVRAIQIVENALKLYGAPIYIKHEIVHNKHVVNSLKEKGAIFVEDLKDIPIGSKVIYSAHGISPQIREEAKKRKLFEIDATCGLVTKIHSAVKRYAKKNYKIILIGKKKHVEIIGIYNEAKDVTTIIENENDVENLSFKKNEKLFFITQTTLSTDDVIDIKNALLKKYPNIETLPTSSICYATTNRQNALKEIVAKVDLILVIGDPTSSNSSRLKEVAIKRDKKAFLVNSKEEIQDHWFKNVQTLAISAGASTPENIVQSCIERLYSLGLKEIEEITYKKEDVVFSLPKELINH